MADYVLTSGDDELTGTPDDDTFDGQQKGIIAGTDDLHGDGGNDTFILNIYDTYYPYIAKGLIDGGWGTIP